jgi:hypothetical protein
MVAVVEQMRNAADGIDGYPITAQEAWNVLGKIQSARAV